MSTAEEMKETLAEIKEDLRSIKKVLSVIVRLEEKVKHHHETLTRIVNKFDSCEKRLGKAELSIAGGAVTDNNFYAVMKWGGAIVAAVIISLIITSAAGKPLKAAIVHNDKHIKQLKKADKKDD